MMQNFGLEDLSHVQSRRNLLKYLVRVEMASDWLRGFIDRFWQNKFLPKSRYGVQTRLRAQEEPATKFARHISILEEICSAKIDR